MNLMLRSMIFNCNSTHPHPIVWGGVGWGGIKTSLAFPHEPDATLYDLQLQFHMNLMLRSMIFNCNSTHPHPIVWGGVGWGGIKTSLAFPHEPDATLYDLQLQFHMNLMLRSMIFNCNSTHPHPIVWGGVGWGGIKTSLAFPHEPDATLYDLQLQFHMNLMLRSMIFNCNSTHPHPIVWGGVGWGGIKTSLAFPHEPDATLYDLQLQFHMNLMLRSMIFNCNSTHPHPIVWGGVGWGGIKTSLAFPHGPDATLYDLQLQFHMNLMLRSMIFNCNSTHPHPIVWGGVGWGGIKTSLAFPHEPDATLYDLQLQFHMNLMLRSMIFNCNSTHPHPIVWGGVGWGGIKTSLAFPHEPDATLYDLQLQFHMNLMLRSMIFNCNSTHPHPIVWGGVGWGGIKTSLAFPHGPDATLYDLQLQFHMNLMLRSMIFNCNSTHPHPIVWGGVGWGGIKTSLAFPHEPDATLYDLHWHFHMILMLRSIIFIGIST